MAKKMQKERNEFCLNHSQLLDGEIAKLSCDTNVDIKFSVYNMFLEQPSIGALKVERLESQTMCNVVI